MKEKTFDSVSKWWTDEREIQKYHEKWLDTINDLPTIRHGYRGQSPGSLRGKNETTKATIETQGTKK